MKKIIYILSFHSHDFENSYSENIIGCESEEKLIEIKKDMEEKSAKLRELLAILKEERERLSRPFLDKRAELHKWRLEHLQWKTDAMEKEREKYNAELEEVRVGLMEVHKELIGKENAIRESVFTLHGYWIEDDDDESFEIEELEMVEI